MRQNYGMVAEMNDRELENVAGGIVFVFVAAFALFTGGFASLIAMNEMDRKKKKSK